MRAGRIAMGVLYAGAGILHFVLTPAYERIVPPYLPDPKALVLISGGFEILGGAGVLLPEPRELPTRRIAAWEIVALLVAVFPANVQMIVDHDTKFRSIPLWMLWARLPLQVPLMYWAWRYTRPTQAKQEGSRAVEPRT